MHTPAQDAVIRSHPAGDNRRTVERPKNRMITMNNSNTVSIAMATATFLPDAADTAAVRNEISVHAAWTQSERTAHKTSDQQV